MNKEERREKQLQMVEAIGLKMEKEGMQPVAGRILALLMVMDQEEYTFDQIVNELGISKSAASTGLKTLQMGEKVDYKTYPGDRKRYFHLRRQEPFALVNDIINDLKEHRAGIKDIISLKEDKNSSNCVFLKNAMDVIDFFLESLNLTKLQYYKDNKNQ